MLFGEVNAPFDGHAYIGRWAISVPLLTGCSRYPTQWKTFLIHRTGPLGDFRSLTSSSRLFKHHTCCVSLKALHDASVMGELIFSNSIFSNCHVSVCSFFLTLLIG